LRDRINHLVASMEVENEIIALGLEFHAIMPAWLTVLVQYPTSRPVRRLIEATFHRMEDLLNG